MAHAPKPFSIRMSPATRARLEARHRQSGEPRSRLAERLIDEGLRMEAHPGIVFGDGPAGRRAALAAGPDVWEVIETVRGTGRKGEAAIQAAADCGNLAIEQVRWAVAYYGEYRKEIDAWIDVNREEAERARASWEALA